MRKRELKWTIIRLTRDDEIYGYDLAKVLASHGEKIQLDYLTISTDLDGALELST